VLEARKVSRGWPARITPRQNGRAICETAQYVGVQPRLRN
jgi:hypothetical protein